MDRITYMSHTDMMRVLADAPQLNPEMDAAEADFVRLFLRRYPMVCPTRPICGNAGCRHVGE